MMQKIKDTNLLLKSRKRFLLFIAVVILTIAYMTSTFSHKKVEIRLYGYWNMVLDSLVINRNTKIEFSVVKEIRHYVMVCKNCGERIRTAPRHRSNDVVYDASVKSLVVYLSVVQFLPYGRIASFCVRCSGLLRVKVRL